MNTTIFRSNLRTFFLLLIAAGIVQAGCQKGGSSAPPIIKNVRAVDSLARDSFFVKAYPGTLITIQGSNLGGLQHVYINGFDASFNSALNSNTNIILTIPTDAPTAPPLNQVSNTIQVVTDHGSASFAFQLVLPPPAIASVSNENAVAGTVLTIWGTNFYGISAVTFPGGVAGSGFTVNSPTQITVTVPAGVTASDTLRLTGTFGNAASPFVFNNWMSPSTGFLANFDGTSSQWSPPSNDPFYGWATQQWVGTYVPSASAFTGSTGFCVEINPSSSKPAGDNSWYQDNNSIIIDPSAWVSDINAPLANYALKFEINVTDWSAGAIWVGTSFPNWNYLASYAPWKSTANGKYSSNGWATVSIPLTQFTQATNNNYSSTAAGAANFNALIGGSSSMLMIMYANDGTANIAGGTFVMGLDNVRIVKIK
jgi:hypothetical protein